MTFRWLHPISLALYGVQFDADPLDHVERIAKDLRTSHGRKDAMDYLAYEIDLELREPTQPVAAILQSRASEEKCREFLTEIVVQLGYTSPVPQPASSLWRSLRSRISGACWARH
ncbi:MAG: hypothetical protein AB7E79_12255 [Rhodospirillaceae bacterium]